MPTSAGILLFRRRAGGTLEVLLVHPGGPFFANKDAGVWTIPKGMPHDGEDLLECAKREFREETGFALNDAGPFLPLGAVKQKGGKTVHAWAAEGDCDAAALRSNTFKLQWPPRSGKWIDVPEVDRAAWFIRADAVEKINLAQQDLIARLVRAVGA